MKRQYGKTHVHLLLVCESFMNIQHCHVLA